MEVDIVGFKEAGLERNCQLAAAVIVAYEYFLQLGNEVEYFWKKHWSIPKGLFLWARYYSLGFNIGNAIVFMQIRASPMVGDKFFHWQNAGACLQTMTTHLILELRLYAMYGSSRRILAFFIVMTMCEVIVMGVIFGVPFPGLVGTNNPFPGLFICADSDPTDGRHWMAYFPTFNLIIECIFLSLALYKAWIHRQPTGGKLMKWLATQSVGYFLAIIWCHIANQVIWILNIITINELATGFSFALPAVLANQLLISVRSERPELNEDLTRSMATPSSIRFHKSLARGRAWSQRNTLELDTMVTQAEH